jgi:NAD(P)-dependent dehydrogenase (short-subunit alcohol dehydrogenase family)
MAVEWGGAGIRVNALAVGLIRTARSRAVVDEVDDAARQVLPLGRVGLPEEIAGPVLFLLSDLASYVTGAVLNVDGGAMARAPYNDASNLPVFVNDGVLRARLLG